MENDLVNHASSFDYAGNQFLLETIYYITAVLWFKSRQFFLYSAVAIAAVIFNQLDYAIQNGKIES